MRAQNICFCVTAWHLPEEFYSLLRNSGSDVYVISHRRRSEIPAILFKVQPEKNWFFEANIGYDWGCYQQFLKKGIWKEYNYIFLVHDDLQIKSLDFIPLTIDLLNSTARFVGNGINSKLTSWPRTHLERYAHSKWIPPDLDFEHETIRGSFLATTRDALQLLSNFEVFWDPHHVHTRLGNHSQIASCGKIQDIFGEGCFAFLGSSYRESPFIHEEERGNRESRLAISFSGRLVTRLYKALGRSYVKHRMQNRGSSKMSVGYRSIGRFLSLIDGVAR